MKYKRMRLLREKHSISMTQLSRHSDISRQRLYEIEAGKGTGTIHMNHHVETAFSRLIASKQQDLAALDADFQKHRRNLLDYVDGEGEVQ